MSQSLEGNEGNRMMLQKVMDCKVATLITSVESSLKELSFLRLIVYLP